MLKKPVVSEIAYKTYAINEYGMATCFLLLGDERGLLIDAGCGWANIKEIADSLTKLPYDVALSHGHCDHIGSAPLFDKVWLHPADHAMALDRERNKRMTLNYPDMMRPFGTFDAYDIKPEDVVFYDTDPEYLPLEDGKVFDLGGRLVETMCVPGHTEGSVVFFDPNTRILFSGDACNVNLGLMACGVTTSLEALRRIKERESEFDRNFNGHIGYGGNPDSRSMPPSVLDDCLHILGSILDGTAEVQVMDGPGGMPARHFVRYGAVRISFDPARIAE